MAATNSLFSEAGGESDCSIPVSLDPHRTSSPRSRLTLLCTLEGHTDRVWNLALHPTRNLLASCSSDKTVRLWAAKQRVKGPSPAQPPSSDDRRQESHVNQSRGVAGPVYESDWVCTGLLEDFTTRTVRAAAWSPDGTFLACGSFDSMVTVWKLASPASTSCMLTLVATLEGHDNEVKGIAWSPTGSLLASCSRDKSVWLWEYDEREGDFACAAVLHGHGGDVKAVKWHPSRELLVSASYDDTVRVWGESEAEADWACIQTLGGHSSTVWAAAFSPGGDRLATVSDDASMMVWEGVPPQASQRDQARLSGGALDADAADSDPGSGSWNRDAAANVIDALRFHRVATIPAAHDRCIYGVDWSPELPLSQAHSGAADGAAAGNNTSHAAPSDQQPNRSTHPTVRTVSVIATCGADDSIRFFIEDLGVGRTDTAALTTGAAQAGDGQKHGHAAVQQPAVNYVRTGVHAKAHSSDVNCVLWHPRDDGILFSAGDDGCVNIWRHTWGDDDNERVS